MPIFGFPEDEDDPVDSDLSVLLLESAVPPPVEVVVFVSVSLDVCSG